MPVPVLHAGGSDIYANGIMESEQDSGASVNVYPEVTGTVVKIAVREGQAQARRRTADHQTRSNARWRSSSPRRRMPLMPGSRNC
ncbi:hypothetical protein CupriaWKF_10120 [Cupriavidus sp. WKF15]|nr:hypothetical protein [Cupriavidus sp. WKF15]WER44700.1 hypothetical protein CupriaWKF_10120 [Cupriavidus sp. WKF15]